MNILKQPIRRQVIGLAVAMILPLGAGIVWSATRTRLERQAEVRSESLSVAATAAAYLEQYLSGLDAIASSLGRHPAVLSLDRPAVDRLFQDVLAEQPLLTNLLLLGPDGEVRGSAISNAVGYSQRPWIDAVVKSGRRQVGDFSIGWATGKPVIAIAYPVRRTGAPVAGVLALMLDLTELQTVFAKIPLPAGSVVSVVDRQDRIVARSLDAQRYLGQPNGGHIWSDSPRTELRADIDGVERFSGDMPLTNVPWIVTVGIPQSVVAARLWPLFQRNLILVIATTILSLLLSLLLANVISSRLSLLRSAVQQIARGDLSPPNTTPMPNRELADLQDAFVVMATNLRTTRDALDRQVEQERRMNEALQSLQRQVVRQERLAAVGLLVSGVAHELNNPLQAILGTAELLERNAALTPEVLEEVGFVKIQSGRAREIIRSLSRFSSQQSGAPSIIDLRDVITEVVQLRKTDLDAAGVDLDVRLDTAGRVFANFTELEQVTLNFVINAEQALESGAVSRRRILIHLFETAGRVCLEVSDNGPGVRPDDEAKLFQPFFTTKPVGKGTGLGLSVSYGIIDSYGGTIGHRSNEWRGATFFFELPALAVAADHPHDRTSVLRQPV